MEELHPSQQAEERIASDSVIAPGDFNLWDVPTTILVRFMEDQIEQNENQLEMPEHAIQKRPCAGKWDLTAEQILQWANRWSTTPKSSAHAGDKNFIPKFELAERRETSHNNVIVVVLNERGKNFTIYGKHQGSIEQPNMWLDLSTGDDRHKQHLVVHEFGHALGLGHEHQRPDFWKLIEPFIDKDKMERDTGECCSDWKMDEDLKANCKKGTATRYDSESVMHYWFMTEWLLDGYHDKQKIEDDYKCKKLTKKKRDALMAVHDCDRREATEPSAKDLEFLNKIYRSTMPV